MKSRQFIVDIIGILVVLLSILSFSIVPVEAQRYSEVIHANGPECLVYNIEGDNIYLNVSAIYNVYSNGSLIEQEYPMWVAQSNGSVITIIYREYITDISGNGTTFYEKVYNTTYGKYIVIEFYNESTSLSIFDDSRNPVESYQEGVNGSLQLIYSWGYGISRMNISCSEFFVNDINGLGGIADDNIMIYLALAYTPMIVVIVSSVYYFIKKKIIIRRKVYKTN